MHVQGQYRGKRGRRTHRASYVRRSRICYASSPCNDFSFATRDGRAARKRKSIASITRHHLERDEGIVCAASDCRTPHRRGGLAPRCRIVASWGCSWSQGLGCSPIKAVRDLGSERRETVRSLSAVGVGDLRSLDPSTRGPGRTNLW